MKKTALVAAIIFVVGGFFATYYGLTNKIQLLTGVGLFFGSIGLVILGAHNIISRESVEQDDAGNVTTYRGISAIVGGILWIVLGIGVFICSVAVLIGQQEQLFKWISEHPGIALVGLGLILLTYGSQTFLGSEEERGSALSFLGSLPGRIFALIVILVGLALLAAGLVEIFAPAIFQAGVTGIQTWLKDLKCQMNPIYCGQ